MARILFVTSRLPFPPKEGHQLRSWHLLRALASQHEVILLSFLRRDDDASAIASMPVRLAGVETFPIESEQSRLALLMALLRGSFGAEPFVAAKYASQAMRARIAALAGTVDAVHFDMLPLMRYADAVPASVPVVYNAHNVEHQLLDTRMRIHPNRLARLFLRRQLPRLRAFERDACRRARLVLACSGTDAQLLRPLAPGVRVAIVPNGVDLEANVPVPTSSGRARLVFVGQMGWFPNRDGVEWFLRDVFPRILLLRPDAEFVLVGKAQGLVVPADIAGHVTLAGFVPDLRPLVHAAAVYVVPLRAGSGTRLKVLEAMALGKAIVTTTIGSEGIVLKPGDSALYADDAGEFARAAVSLLDSPALRARLGAAARLCAEKHYGWDAIGRDLLAFYEPLLPETVCQPPRPERRRRPRGKKARRSPAGTTPVAAPDP
ncbi:MAG TPA: glycosyltransferase family 4 protein [Luteimonas sp.]|nr:glycosyltransferase family 4 protein [Luteimonas sp.]